MAELDALVSYFDRVLQRSAYPDDFPHHFRLAYVPESRQLVTEFELPLAMPLAGINLATEVSGTASR